MAFIFGILIGCICGIYLPDEYRNSFKGQVRNLKEKLKK